MTIKEEFEKRNKVSKKYIDKRLVNRLIAYVIVFFTMLGILFYDLSQVKIGPFWALISVFVGALVGLVAQRIVKISWHESEEIIVARFDRIGFIIFVFYILFSVFRQTIWGNFIHGSALSAFAFGTYAGIMFVRYIFNATRISKLLRDKGIL